MKDHINELFELEARLGDLQEELHCVRAARQMSLEAKQQLAQKLATQGVPAEIDEVLTKAEKYLELGIRAISRDRYGKPDDAYFIAEEAARFRKYYDQVIQLRSK